jgi:hypothetical protein
MKHALVALVLFVAACGKSGEDQAKEDNAREAAKIAAEAPKEEAKPATPTPATPPPTETNPADKPPEPEPTTPAEIDKARNQAMIDGRDKDVLKYCEMGKVDDKSSPQVLLGCTLAACRLKDEATAKKYGEPIKGPLRDQAKKVCITNQIGI